MCLTCMKIRAMQRITHKFQNDPTYGVMHRSSEEVPNRTHISAFRPILSMNGRERCCAGQMAMADRPGNAHPQPVLQVILNCSKRGDLMSLHVFPVSVWMSLDIRLLACLFGSLLDD